MASRARLWGLAGHSGHTSRGSAAVRLSSGAIITGHHNPVSIQHYLARLFPAWKWIQGKQKRAGGSAMPCPAAQHQTAAEEMHSQGPVAAVPQKTLGPSHQTSLEEFSQAHGPSDEEQHTQQALLEAQDAARTVAALCIQAGYRRYLLRTRLIVAAAAYTGISRRLVTEKKAVSVLEGHWLAERAAIAIQSAWRGARAHRSYDKLRSAALTLQKHWRGAAAASRYALARSCIIKLQARWKGRCCRVEYLQQKRAAVRLQSTWRGRQVCTAVAELRKAELLRAELVCKTAAATKIQALVRMFLQRCRYLKAKCAAGTVLQELHSRQQGTFCARHPQTLFMFRKWRQVTRSAKLACTEPVSSGQVQGDLSISPAEPDASVPTLACPSGVTAPAPEATPPLSSPLVAGPTCPPAVTAPAPEVTPPLSSPLVAGPTADCAPHVVMPPAPQGRPPLSSPLVPGPTADRPPHAPDPLSASHLPAESTSGRASLADMGSESLPDPPSPSPLAAHPPAGRIPRVDGMQSESRQAACAGPVSDARRCAPVRSASELTHDNSISRSSSFPLQGQPIQAPSPPARELWVDSLWLGMMEMGYAVGIAGLHSWCSKVRGSSPHTSVSWHHEALIQSLQLPSFRAAVSRAFLALETTLQCALPAVKTLTSPAVPTITSPTVPRLAPPTIGTRVSPEGPLALRLEPDPSPGSSSVRSLPEDVVSKEDTSRRSCMCDSRAVQPGQAIAMPGYQIMMAPDQRGAQRQRPGADLQAYLAQARQPHGAANQVFPPARAVPHPNLQTLPGHVQCDMRRQPHRARNLQTFRGQARRDVPRQPQGTGKQVLAALAHGCVQRQDVRMEAFPPAGAFPNPAADHDPAVMQHRLAGQGAAPPRAMRPALPCLEPMLAETQRLAQRQPQATGIQAFPAALALLNPAAHQAVPGMQHLFAGNRRVPLQHLFAGMIGAGLQHLPSLLPGVHHTSIQEVRLGEVLGDGGFGIVLGAATQTHGKCAIKILKPTATAEACACFIQEIELMASLDHPYVLRFHSAVFEPGYPPRVIAHLTERVQLGSLTQFLGRYMLSAAQMVILSLRLAEGVEYIHIKGILHLDLKPDNVLVVRDVLLGLLPKIADLGLAAPGYVEGVPLDVGIPRGTPTYMSPEMIATQGHSITAAADVFALGGVFAYMGRAVLLAAMQQPWIPVRPSEKYALNLYRALCDDCLQMLPGRRSSLPKIKERLQGIMGLFE